MTNSHKQIYIKTYGCQMNEYDSAKIAEVMAANGDFRLTDDVANADLIVFNTCSVREKAQEKVFSDLGRVRPLKKTNHNLVIAVGGCVSSQEGKNIFQRAPYVNIVFGPQTLHRLPELYNRALNGEKKIIDIDFPAIEKFDLLPKPAVSEPSAFVAIMEGCNKFCSYCIVPYTRGREVSRDVTNVMNEVNSLAQLNVKEITFLGQNVNAYRGADKNNQATSLAQLIELTATAPGIERIRFTTSHPAEFTADLVASYANTAKLANHLHLPVQSGSDKVLKTMRRRYTVAEFCDIVAALRAVRPNISVSSDFIVGFPGETASDFQATMDLVKKINFDNSFSFMYSPRPGTTAAKLVDNVPLTEKKRRLSILQQQLTKQAQQISAKMLGNVEKVLITGTAKKSNRQLTGRTENNRVVNFDGDKQLIGQLVNVKIVEVLPNSLRGEILKNKI